MIARDVSVHYAVVVELLLGEFNAVGVEQTFAYFLVQLQLPSFVV